jgi:hypothetical protein
VGRICRIILFGLLSAIGCRRTTNNSDEKHDKDKISSQYSNIFYRLDQENMLERDETWLGMSDYLIAVGKSDNSISGMLLATGEFVQCGYQSHMALFPLLKTARVASGENSLSSDALSVSSNLLTGSMAYCLQSQSFFRRELADQQSSSRTLENQRHKHYSILTEMRAL